MRLAIVAVLASVATSIEYGRYEGSGSCAVTCDERQEFCGTDNQCYRYGSCANWYRYGPSEFTGHDYVSEVRRRRQNLSCQDIDATTDKNGIIYGYEGCIDSLPDGEGFAQGLTRECMAQNSGKQFVCYEMADNMDFEPFQNRLRNCEGGGTGGCGGGNGMGNYGGGTGGYGGGNGMGNYGGDTGGHGGGNGMGNGGLVCRNESQPPRYIYQIYLECPGFPGTGGGLESEEFNETLAQMTMYSYLKETSHALVHKFRLIGLLLAVATIFFLV
jgi:hypothetical protein